MLVVVKSVLVADTARDNCGVSTYSYK
jgi:hypothetical protein